MTSSRGITFDLSRHPLVTVRLGRGYGNADWDQMLRDLTELIERAPFGLVADLRSGQMPNATQRRSFVAVYEAHDRLTRTNFLALGAVGDSTLLQRVITVLNWIRLPPHPVKVLGTPEAAESWVLEQLPDAMRQRVPPAQQRPRR